MRRIVWTIAVASSTVLVASVVVALGTTPREPSFAQYLLTVPIPFLVAGMVLLARHPGHRAGPLLVVATTASMTVSAVIELVVRRRFPTEGIEPWMPWALTVEAVVSMVGLAGLCLLIGLFPDTRPRSRTERLFARGVWWLPVPMLVALLANEAVLVERIGFGEFPEFPNPIHVEWLGWLGPATASMRYVLYSAVVVAVALLFLRYRRVGPQTRAQIRWVLFGAIAAVSIGIIPVFIGPFLGPDSPAHGPLLTLGSLALLLIPVTIVLAIEQPTWVDADELIRKSFIYGALSFGIFVIYAALAAGLGLAAGARLPLEVAILVTAVLAFAFQPVRARLQAVADRWVFGERPSPLAAITGLDEGMHAEGSVGEVAGRLAELVGSVARLRWVEVRIADDVVETIGTADGEPALVVPVERGRDALGVIRCGPKVSGSLDDRDREMIDALAAQAALLVANVRLAGRIVGAQEVERRRIERNIHDGAQQELVALVAKLGLARTRARAGELGESLLVDLQHDAQAILRDLRELAQGIHPSVLTDGGLVEAVEDRCSRFPIDVTVSATPDLRSMRFADDVEGAAYFFVTEGLANVLKHASASAAGVHLARRNGDLELTVTDDGVGFDPDAVRRNGLAGLSDRVAALSGSVRIEARPGAGAVLMATIPVETS